jgi:hypothetical protein
MLTRYNTALSAADIADELSSMSEAMARRVYLAAVPPEIGAPLALGGMMLHRLRVIVTVPGGGVRSPNPERLIGPLPSLAARQALLEQHADALEVNPRPVRGEILRDESGRFYERVGRRIRPIAELAASSQGEPLVIEAKVIREPDRRGIEPAEAEPSDAGSARPKVRPRPREQTEAPAEGMPPARVLFAPPGLWRVVTFGEFRDMLAPQLAHPERLRDTHKIPCYLQVIEAGVDLPVAEFVQAALGPAANQALLQPWSVALGARLQISLPADAVRQPGAQLAPGLVRAGTRFFRLDVASDPTAELSKPERRPSDEPARSAPASPAAARLHTARPWEFSVSQDEATYDMQLAASREGIVRRLTRCLFPLVGRADLRKWHVLIAGKSPSQQLWEVTPPRNGLRDPRVRRWVAEALRLAGDPETNLDKWEIHWRRKGLR